MYENSHDITIVDIQELKEENKYIPQLSTKIKECSQKIEQISGEFDGEKQKGARLAKENDSLRKEVEDLRFRCAGENAPETLRKQIDSQKSYTEELELTKASLQIKLKEAEAIGKEMELDCGEELGAVAEGIRSVTAFLETAFTDLKSVDTGIWCHIDSLR